MTVVNFNASAVYPHPRDRTPVEASWNVMAQAQRPDFVFRRNGRVHLNRPGGGRQFSRILAAEVCPSAVVMLDTTCSEVAWWVLATHCIRQFPLHFPSCASPCANTFQLESTHWSITGFFLFGPRGCFKSKYGGPSGTLVKVQCSSKLVSDYGSQRACFKV